MAHSLGTIRSLRLTPPYWMSGSYNQPPFCYYSRGPISIQPELCSKNCSWCILLPGIIENEFKSRISESFPINHQV